MSFLNRLSSLFGRGAKPTDQKTPIQPKVTTQPKQPTKAKISQKDQKSNQQFLSEAKAQAREIVIEAKDEAIKIKQSAEQSVADKKAEVEKIQQNLYRTQADADRKLGRLEEKEKVIEKEEKQLEQKFEDVEKIKKEQIEKLERVATLTRNEAKDLIMKATEDKLKNDIGRKIKEVEDETREIADEKAKEILIDAMRHGATDYVAEYSVSIVRITDEEIKGRVIGREGRNIRNFEQITGVDVDLDEEGIIRLSCFDSVRREIARVSLETLIRDGRIQPARIEEIVEKTTEELDRVMFKAGQDLCHRVKVFNLPKEVVQMLGRFKYRYSYGQNLIAHTLEVTKLGIALALETKADVNTVRLGCLLHDIGKVINDEEGTHVDLGLNFLKKYGIKEEILNAVYEHHQDREFSSVESVLVYVADAISGARPGARYEDYEGYVKRMRELEDTAVSFDMVKNAYAIQAGREVRVIVDPQKADDAATYKLAQDIRDKIKKELTYPGSVKVTVIRQLRKSEIAN